MNESLQQSSFVSLDDRAQYIDGSTCLTFWYDERKNILAFEVIFNLLVDEWALLYHRNGNCRYCQVDDGEERIGRPQKQVFQGQYEFPEERMKEFSIFDGGIPQQEKEFVIDIMRKLSLRI